MTHEYPLEGCKPEPLMSYLKALGILRIVTEQADPKARGRWKNGVFWLKTDLDRDNLVDFFVEEYQPTPILGPWNGGGGFLQDTGSALKTINDVYNDQRDALKPLHKAIQAVYDVPILKELHKSRKQKKVLEKEKEKKKKTGLSLSDQEKEELRNITKRVDHLKTQILFGIRAQFPDDLMQWIDACITILPDSFKPAPLLGSGGNDGRLDFSINFLSNILLFLDQKQKERRKWVKNAISDEHIHGLVSTSIGQFAPGQAGGVNSTQGFEGKSLVNPLDFILMLEGSLLLTGSARRRYQTGLSTKALFPFTVFSTSSGGETLIQEESKASRGEIWMPLWKKPASLQEISHLLAEGRADVFQHKVDTGLDFARSIASLGVDRGLSGFQRFGFLPRNGKAFFATPLGRFDVQARPDVDLLRETDQWFDRFRRAASGDKIAPRFQRSLHRIEDAMFDYAKYGGSRRFSDILCALGAAEREIALSEGKISSKSTVSPLHGLSPEWIRAAFDSSVEFEIALALAGIYDPGNKLPPIRSNLEPVKVKPYTAWADKGRAVVWNSGGLAANMAAVLERRMMDGARANSKQLPIASKRTVSLDAISFFLSGQTDDHRLEELLWGLMLIDHWKPYPEDLARAQTASEMPLPRLYALLKLLFLPYPADPGASGETIIIRAEHAILPLLRANRTGEAAEIAMRRLRSSGLVPMPHRVSGGVSRDRVWKGTSGGCDVMRLAAALLMPVSTNNVHKLAGMVLRPLRTGLVAESAY